MIKLKIARIFIIYIVSLHTKMEKNKFSNHEEIHFGIVFDMESGEEDGKMVFDRERSGVITNFLSVHEMQLVDK